ncbi:hypothetical protein ACNKFW_12135 (plasmid) [Paracoccus sp. TD-10]|uniref:hypothetical protein n=1 Tax=Paracoccus sp. TD-10 TaxID=3395918 RepID=UPI003AAC6BA2
MPLPASRRAFCAHHYRDDPDLVERGGSRTWITRGVNLVIAVTEAQPGAVLARQGQPDEYMALLPAGTEVDLTAGGQNISCAAESLAIMPPGPSGVHLPKGGRITRIFTSRATDLATLAVNAGDYTSQPDSDVAPLCDWPAPPDGFRIRVYDLARYLAIDGPRIQPRVFRCTNLMVNVFAPWHDRRDPASLSPHWHEDFEQVSLGLQGHFIHHIRYPWGSDSTRWQADEHIACASPSVAIIPPPAIHTTQDVGEGTTRLVDIFAPPRADFALRPGFVLNETDYPLPDGPEATVNKSGGTMSPWQTSR